MAEPDTGAQPAQAPGSPLWDDAAFRDRVRRMAFARGMTLEEIQARSGLSAAWLRHPADRYGRGIDAILRLARVLEVNPVELLGLQSECHRRDRLADALNLVALLYRTLDTVSPVEEEALLAFLERLIRRDSAATKTEDR
jgi:transcriptional regulator with XRE-family HTH domain